VYYSEAILCLWIVLSCSFFDPFFCLGIILGDAQSAFVHQAEAVLCLGIILFGGLAVPLNGDGSSSGRKNPPVKALGR
jgi:hypothetical protein